MKMPKIVRIILKIVAAVSLLMLLASLIITAYVYWKQDSMIFTVSKIEEGAEYKVPANFESVLFKTPEGYTYKCWFVKRENYATKPTIQYVLGNGSYIEGYIDTYTELSDKLDANIFACSMRGCGTYKGNATEELLYKDAQMYLEYLEKRNLRHIFIHGRSMGGAVAIEMAKQNPTAYAGLIVENTFSNLKEIVRKKKPFLFFFIIGYDWIVRTKMRNDEKIATIQMPTFFLVSLKDTIVDPSHSINLFNLSPSKYKYVFSSKEGTHNNVKGKDVKKFYDEYTKFLKVSIKVFDEAAKEEEETEPQAITSNELHNRLKKTQTNEDSRSSLRG